MNRTTRCETNHERKRAMQRRAKHEIHECKVMSNGESKGVTPGQSVPVTGRRGKEVARPVCDLQGWGWARVPLEGAYSSVLHAE